MRHRWGSPGGWRPGLVGGRDWPCYGAGMRGNSLGLAGWLSARVAVTNVLGQYTTSRSSSVVQARYHGSKPSMIARPAPNDWPITAARPGRLVLALTS